MINRYKSWNISKIFSELDKLLITLDYIDIKEIEEYISPELEESVFVVVDDILNKNINSAISKIDTILNDTNIYAFYNNLLANLRTSLYISKLKNMQINNSKIWELLSLWNRSFLINKNYKINISKLSSLYIWLVNLDKKMKSWKMIWTEEKDFKYEFERVLLAI